MRFAAYFALGFFLCFLAALAGGKWYLNSLGPRAKARVIRDLQERFDADVELKNLELHVLPFPSVSGEGLVIRHKGWPDAHPLLVIASFTADATFWDLIKQRDKVNQVRLQGLQIHLPRRGASVFGSANRRDQTHLRISIREIVADNTLLEIEPKTADKDPLRFQIEKLTLHSVGMGEPLSFRAELMNAKPPGLIHSMGTFGPWQKDDPRSTAVTGKYRFDQADLGVFKGIRGTLSSVGQYSGELQKIEVQGTTDTPDFALKRSGSPVHLTTSFHAVVDGMDGETVLDPVDAKFLHSEFICKGGVVKLRGEKAKTVDLYAVTRQARMEDILQLVLGDKQPVLTGAVDFRSRILIPPGDEDVADKLQLDGQFKISSGYFSSPKVEQRLQTLSDRARGITKSDEQDQPPQTVASNFRGDFRLKDGVFSFAKLSFEVPGSQVRLTGNYDMKSQAIDMAGVFRMRATLADTQSGIKHWLLKPLDPLFEKNGAGFEIPFEVKGDRSHPEVSVYAFHHRFNVE